MEEEEEEEKEGEMHLRDLVHARNQFVDKEVDG